MATCRHAHHGHGHSHGHSHHNSTADIWTTLAAIGEGTASVISDAYWLGGLIDLAGQLDDAGYGLSWYGMGFGTAIALITAAGSAYSHSVLNITHQESFIEPSTHHDQVERKSVNAEDGMENQQVDTQVLNEEDTLIDDHDNDHEYRDSSIYLTWAQKAALAADWVSHTGDIAGPITFIADIAAKDRLPLWGKALVQGGATLFGGISSIANVRTCKNSMLALNKNQQDAAMHLGFKK